MPLELPMELKSENGQVIARLDEDGFHYEHPYYPDRWSTIKGMIRNRLLVKMDAAPRKTPSGILWLPEVKQKTSQIGTVLMKSENYWDFQAEEWRSLDEIELGARVLFRPVSGFPLYYGMEFDIWFFRPGSIMAVIEGGEDLEPHQMPHTHIGYQPDPDEEDDDDDDGPVIETLE